MNQARAVASWGPDGVGDGLGAARKLDVVLPGGRVAVPLLVGPKVGWSVPVLSLNTVGELVVGWNQGASNASAWKGASNASTWQRSFKASTRQGTSNTST